MMMTSWKSRVWKGVGLTLSFVTLSSCCWIHWQPPCIGTLRRPFIYKNKECCILDYSPCLKEPPYQEEEDEGKVYSVDEDMLKADSDEDEVYLIGRGDVFEMQVFGDQETLADEVVIAPDGRLYYAFVDGIPAAGRPVDAVRRDVEEKLTDLYVNPQVAMNLKASQNQFYRILGRVKSPGMYPIYGSLRLREAIAQAGGIARERFNEKADNARLFLIADFDHSFIVRKDRKIRPDFHKVLFSCDNTQNIFVKPNDYIYIAPNKARAVFVLGAVRESKRIPYEDNIKLSSVIAQAGGWTRDPARDLNPDLHKVYILRRGKTCPIVAQVDFKKIINGQAYDLTLLPDDIVFVPNQKFRFARELVRTACFSFAQSFGITAGQYFGGNWFTAGTDVIVVP